MACERHRHHTLEMHLVDQLHSMAVKDFIEILVRLDSNAHI